MRLYRKRDRPESSCTEEVMIHETVLVSSLIAPRNNLKQQQSKKVSTKAKSLGIITKTP